MKLTCVMFRDSEHYETICGWWKAHKWPEIPLEMLPQTGLIAIVDEIPAAAVWIYRTDSSICWPEWMVCNPCASKPQREVAIEFLLDQVVIEGRRMGFSQAFTFVKSKHSRYIKRLLAHGCIKADTVTNYIRRL